VFPSKAGLALNAKQAQRSRIKFQSRNMNRILLRKYAMILPVEWKTGLKLLPEEDLFNIHDASLHILEHTGMFMPLGKQRLNDLSDFGLKVDRKTNVVRFPRDMVENALVQAPDAYILHARNPENNLSLDGQHGYLSLDGTGLKVKDLETGLIRNSTCKDLAQAARLADFLPQISFLWPCVSAQDRPTKTQPLYELQALMNNSAKHIQAMTAVNPLTAKGTVEMAAAVAGGKAALKKKPIISNFQSLISPLTSSAEGMEAALVFAEAGVPVGFVTMQIGCATAPATLAGNMALGNAEILAGITFLQLYYPGTPCFYGSYATMMDLKTGGMTSGNPEDFLLQAAAIQLAHYYRLPITIGTFGTGAAVGDDWRSGVENAISGAASLFARGDMLCGAGLLEGATVFSFEQLIKDCEIYDMLRIVSQGISVTPETLALEDIHRVGPQNHYMVNDHTLSHMHDIWQPAVKGCHTDDTTTDPGVSCSDAIAAEQARDILKNHTPDPLKNAHEVQEILDAYDRLAMETPD
jgi:trimethylamine:corrinoid methyltransferase-like protein